MTTAEEFKQEVWDWAKEVDVKPKEIHLRRMRRKWASCSSKGRLTFDTSLLNKSKEVRSKAILHELLHLKYPNYGRMFKLLLNSYLAKISDEEDKERQ